MIVAADAHTIDLEGGIMLPEFIDGHDRLATLAVTRLGVEVSGVTSLSMLTALDTVTVENFWRVQSTTMDCAPQPVSRGAG